MTAIDSPSRQRKFLVVVDDSPECRRAVHFAIRRAVHTGGGVVMLYIIRPADFQHWISVEERMREEAHEEAETVLEALATRIKDEVGIEPEKIIREGNSKDEILRLIEDDSAISVLVLGASTDTEGPGPLVTSFGGQLAGSLRIPVTIVPGGLNREQIDAIS